MNIFFQVGDASIFLLSVERIKQEINSKPREKKDKTLRQRGKFTHPIRA